MTIEVEVFGTGRFAGHKTNISSYSYSEESTPHSIGDDSGGVGAISIVALDNSNDGMVLYRDIIRLSDSRYGSATGRIDSINSTDGVLNLTASSRLVFININGTITAGTYTIRGLIRSVLDEAGVQEDVAFSPLIVDSTIPVPGYEGDLWVFLKEFLSAYGLEINLINNTIYFQPIRQREIVLENLSSITYNISDLELAQSFDVAYYNYQSLSNVLAYPYGGWNSEVPNYSVRANETITFEVDVDGYLTSILPLQAQNTVAKNYSGPNSVYSVSGTDGLPIPASQWLEFGGSLTAELIENGTKILFTAVGMNFESLSPFNFSISDGATDYSTIRLVGSGVFSDRQVFNVKTGATPNIAPQEKGAEIDNPFVSTIQQAIDLGIKARRKYALPNQTIDASGLSFVQKNFTEYDYFELDDDVLGLLDGESVLAFVNRNDAIALFQSFDTFNSNLPTGYIFSDFNDDYVDSTFEDFANSVAENFSQSFGFVSGSRVFYYDAFYRVRSSEISQNGITISAEFDTLFSDFNERFAGESFDSFDETMITLDFTDYSLMPLRRDPYADFDYLFLDEGRLDVSVLGFLG
jgi:hypothetical protein